MSEENELAYDMSEEWAMQLQDALRAYDQLIANNNRQEVTDMEAALEKKLSGDDVLFVREDAARFVGEMMHELSRLQVEGFEFRNQRIQQLARMLEEEGMPAEE